jgi:hypothetical protein
LQWMSPRDWRGNSPFDPCSINYVPVNRQKQATFHCYSGYPTRL